LSENPPAEIESTASPSVPLLICEVCGARVSTLRRGRCWICYVRWAEAREVGLGATCVICNDRRRDNLRQVEFQGGWLPMCHNCATRAMRLSPMPQSVDGLRQRLMRDRRWQDRREESSEPSSDDRIIRKERRVGERRLTLSEAQADWLDAADLIIEVIDVAEADDPLPEATRIVAAAEVERSSD
jgi:hypothetical protein